MTDDEKRIMGNAILAGRQAAKKSQEELADEMEIGLSTYRRLESGAGNTTLDNLVTVMQKLKLDAGTVFSFLNPGQNEEQVGRILTLLGQLGKEDLDIIEKMAERLTLNGK